MQIVDTGTVAVLCPPDKKLSRTRRRKEWPRAGISPV